MTTPTDICNRALSEMGTQSTIASLSESSPEAVQCALWYTTLRQQLLRMANWGFARRQVVLTELGNYADATSPYPWLYKYAYPSDCIKFRYTIAPPYPAVNPSVAPQVGVGPVGPQWGPSRACRFLIDEDVDGSGVVTKTIISNVSQAIGAYTMDVVNPDRWDSLFEGAMVAALAYRLVIPLSGNVGMRQDFAASAERMIIRAQVADGNEAVPSSDHTVDWIEARGCGYPGGYAYGQGLAGWGSWYGSNDAMNWGM